MRKKKKMVPGHKHGGINQGFSRVMIWPAGRVGSGRVVLCRVVLCRVVSCRVGSCRFGSDRVGSGRVGSDRVGSGRVNMFSNHGSGRVTLTLSDPRAVVRPVRRPGNYDCSRRS